MHWKRYSVPSVFSSYHVHFFLFFSSSVSSCVLFSSLFFVFFPLCVFSNVARPVTKRTRAEEVMHLAVVACGNRLDETLTMVKSALLFSIKRITFHIFAEDPLAPQFKERVRILHWPDAKKYTGQIFQIKRGTGATSPTV